MRTQKGYVPIVKRYNMPPVNTLNVDFKLIPGDEIRCDGLTCEALRVFSSFDTGSFYTGYGHTGNELNDINNFGSIFESSTGELLWLHRFIYRDLRDDRSQTIERLQAEGQTLIYYGLSRLIMKRELGSQISSMASLPPIIMKSGMRASIGRTMSLS